VPLSVKIRDGGVPVDPFALSLSIDRPDGTVDAVDPLQVGVGDFRAEYVVTVPGTYGVLWTSTEPNVAHRDQITVVDSRRVMPIGLAEVKSWLKIEGTGSDEVLRGLIAEVCDIGESYTGTVFGRRTEVAELRGTGTTYLQLPVGPILSVLSVEIDGEDTATDWRVMPDAAILDRISGWPLGAEVTVTYTAGFRAQPGQHITGARALIKHVWRESRGAVKPGAPVDEWMPFGVGYYVADFWGMGRITGFA
jgi:hypothetical protein